MTPDNPEMVAVLRKAKEFGFSDRQLAEMWKKPEGDIRALRRETGTVPTYYLVDTCAAEFEAYTPYFYSTYETGQEVVPADRKKVIILGGGPNRIGQGIPSTRVLKVYEGRPNIVDLIKNGEVSLVINTASGKRTAHDSKAIRQATLHYGVPYSTTLSGAKAIARAIGAARTTEVRVKSLQEYYKGE